MRVPSFRAVVLAMLIQKVDALEGDGWSLGSLLGWFGGVAHLTSQSDVKWMWRVTLKISLFRWVAPPFQPRVGAFYMLRGVWLPNCLPLEGVNHIHTHMP
jgi:hypothetical protein